ncbi:cupredoxin domain-containing protein [Halioxenophilus sp. WMMB6]|uniref:cupredoxin domain-containing protein n=1 Tax=Halioxenophilus sp. WMMB6 TaxID=3073815 RepID=UPI00295F1FB7|nr:cupredoxin domain-containing protein [Halioxenophilus sp. WMMB6]
MIHSRQQHSLLWRSLLLAAALLLSQVAVAAPVIELHIRDHLFYPAELMVPANTKIKLVVINEDATAEEFESYELNREKVVLGNSRAVIFIGPLAPGEYPFFGEFNLSTAQGKIIVKDE